MLVGGGVLAGVATQAAGDTGVRRWLVLARGAGGWWCAGGGDAGCWWVGWDP